MMCVFQVVFLKRTVQAAWDLFSNVYFPEFRDASIGTSTYLCSITHCVKALTRAIGLNWYNPSTFDVKAYEYYANLNNGDFNWVVPKKLLAFSNPSSSKIEIYSKAMKNLAISAVIRLNQKTYPAEKFKKLGIRHYDLYFADGTCPSEEIIRKFIQIVENENGAVAVHCRAGLGRAGTLICCYLMKHFEFLASESIAWCRLCRPGSVLGPQQLFLVEIEETCVKWGEAFKKSAVGSSIFGGKNLEEKIPFRRRSFDLKGIEKYQAEKEKGQAKMLIIVKEKNQSLARYSIDDRDAISPPPIYRKKQETMRKTFMNFDQSVFVRDLVSYRLASPTGKSPHSLSL